MKIHEKIINQNIIDKNIINIDKIIDKTIRKIISNQNILNNKIMEEQITQYENYKQQQGKFRAIPSKESCKFINGIKEASLVLLGSKRENYE